MSYARFSSDDHKSDVYCYEDIHTGYRVHVASRRMRNQEECPKIDYSDDSTLIDTHRKQCEWLRDGSAQYETIGLEYDGWSDGFDTLEELYHFLVKLSHIGYHVPDSCFAQILGEMNEDS